MFLALSVCLPVCRQDYYNVINGFCCYYIYYARHTLALQHHTLIIMKQTSFLHQQQWTDATRRFSSILL